MIPVPPPDPEQPLPMVARLRDATARISPYARDITAVLLIKFALLLLLWWAFFSDPATRHQQTDPARIDRQLLQPLPAPEAPHARR